VALAAAPPVASPAPPLTATPAPVAPVRRASRDEWPVLDLPELAWPQGPDEAPPVAGDLPIAPHRAAGPIRKTAPPVAAAPPRENAAPVVTPPSPPRPIERARPPADEFWSLAQGLRGRAPLEPDDTPAAESSAAPNERVVLPEELELSAAATVDVRSHPLGRWMDEVDPLIRAAWRWPPDALALGARGTVAVLITVRPNGRVDPPRLLRSSGEFSLDDAALKSVPQNVPPPPGGEAVTLTYTFRYRDAAPR
jgi:protein TonB